MIHNKRMKIIKNITKMLNLSPLINVTDPWLRRLRVKITNMSPQRGDIMRVLDYNTLPIIDNYQFIIN